MISKGQIEAELELAHVELVKRYFSGTIYYVNLYWGKRLARNNVIWGAIVLVLVGIIIYLLVK